MDELLTRRRDAAPARRPRRRRPRDRGAGSRATARRESPPAPSNACSRPSRPKARTTSRTRRSAGTSPTGRRGAPLDAASDGRRRVHVQADQGRRGRHLALRRRRRLLGLRPGRVQPDVPARDAADERERPRHAQDDLSGLVPGAHGAHPREGARRRQRRAHRPALLPRHADGQGLPEGAVQVAARDARRATRTTSSSRTAARTRC